MRRLSVWGRQVSESKSTGKRLLPPTYFALSLALMAALAFALPIAIVVGWPWRALGLVPIAAGVWLNLVADRVFKARGTTVKAFERSATPVLIGAVSPFFVVAGFAAILEMHFVPVEERMLAETFGDAWLAYRTRTRRWI